MGLSSLIKVAQGKNAANVSFEDSFLKGYEEAVVKYEEEHKQPTRLIISVPLLCMDVRGCSIL